MNTDTKQGTGLKERELSACRHLAGVKMLPNTSFGNIGMGTP